MTKLLGMRDRSVVRFSVIAVGEVILVGIAERLVKGRTTIERCAASAGVGAFDATGADGVIVRGGVRFAPSRYQALAAANAASPSASGASDERFFSGSDGFAWVGGFARAG